DRVLVSATLAFSVQLVVEVRNDVCDVFAARGRKPSGEVLLLLTPQHHGERGLTTMARERLDDEVHLLLETEGPSASVGRHIAGTTLACGALRHRDHAEDPLFGILREIVGCRAELARGRQQFGIVERAHRFHLGWLRTSTTPPSARRFRTGMYFDMSP